MQGFNLPLEKDIHSFYDKYAIAILMTGAKS